MTIRTPFIAIFATSLFLASCQSAPEESVSEEKLTCDSASKIGRFDPKVDLLIANYDSKPDVDDLHAVASLGTILRDPAYDCVDYIATHGAYGIQTGKLLPAKELFDLAFPGNWVDADADREAAVAKLTERAKEALARGGQIWVAEAGQSDVTAAVVGNLPEEDWQRVNVVQHSYWNETQTSEDAMNLLVYNTRYHRVQDGNFSGNGSPNFNTKEARHWDVLLADSVIAPIWSEAKALADKHNPVAEYVNPAVAEGGLDFSDTAEIAYILGFEDMADVGEFAERFARKQ